MATRPLSSVLKVLKLLDLMAHSTRSMRLAEIARITGATRATVYQRLHTLATSGWIEQLPDGAYRLTMRAAQLAHAAVEQASLGERVLPILQDLTVRTGETSSLAVIDDVDAIIVQRVEARGILRTDLRVGSALSMHESASGQILVAFGPPSLKDYLKQRGIRIASDRALARIRKEGIAVAGGGVTLRGIRVVAMPIFGRNGYGFASLSVTGPENGFDLVKIVPAIRDAARRLNDILSGASLPSQTGATKRRRVS